MRAFVSTFMPCYFLCEAYITYSLTHTQTHAYIQGVSMPKRSRTHAYGCQVGMLELWRDWNATLQKQTLPPSLILFLSILDLRRTSTYTFFHKGSPTPTHQHTHTHNIWHKRTVSQTDTKRQQMEGYRKASQVAMGGIDGYTVIINFMMMWNLAVR